MFLNLFWRGDSHIDYSNMVVPDYIDLDLSMITFSRDDFDFWAITKDGELYWDAYKKINYALDKVYNRAMIDKREVRTDSRVIEYLIDLETLNTLKPVYKEQYYILKNSNFIYEYHGFVKLNIWYISYIIKNIKAGLQENDYYAILDVMDEMSIDILKFKYLYSVCQ